MQRLDALRVKSRSVPLVPRPDSISIPVHFATRRTVLDPTRPERHFGNEDAQVLRYGVAYVSIPEQYRPGRDDTRGLCRYLPGNLGCRRGPANSVMVAAVDTQPEAKWFGTVKELVRGDSVGALVFVHGYNNSFASAMTQTAKLAYSVGFPGVAISFDWASKSTVSGYVADREAAERSVPDLKRLLTQLIDSARVGRVAIVAHSMGSRVVGLALSEIARERAELSLGPIILAAADVDSAIFIDQQAKPLADLGNPVTLYASRNDRVLKASSALAGSTPRVGSGPPTLVLHPRVDYVDASRTETDLLGHGYFTENKALIDDIYVTLAFGVPAARRNLIERRLNGVVYFEIK